MVIGRYTVEEAEPTIDELVEHIRKTLRGEAGGITVEGGRGYGKTISLLTAMDVCLRELNEKNKSLTSNYESMKETNEAILKMLLSIKDVVDRYEVNCLLDDIDANDAIYNISLILDGLYEKDI